MPGEAQQSLLASLLDVETGKEREDVLAPRSPLAPSEAPSQLSHLECLLAEEEPMPAGVAPGGCSTSGGVSGGGGEGAGRHTPLPPGWEARLRRSAHPTDPRARRWPTW